MVAGWYAKLLEWLYPPRCLFCHSCVVDSEIVDICSGCYRQLPRIHNRCFHCGVPLRTMQHHCGRCIQRDIAFDHIVVPCGYRWPVTEAIKQFKFSRKLYFRNFLAELLWHELQRSGLQPQLLIPVPLHTARLQHRGFNQATELAQRISVLAQIPYTSALVQRQRDTSQQVGLSAKQRQINMANAFTLQSGVELPQHIAIVDDVVTTGATISAIAQLLRQRGVATITVLAVAKAAA